MGDAEFISKGQSQCALAKVQTGLSGCPLQEGWGGQTHRCLCLGTSSTWAGRLQNGQHEGLQMGTQHHLAHINSSLRCLHERHFGFGSSADSSSSTQGGVMRHHSLGGQHLFSQGTNSCLQPVTPVIPQGSGLGQATCEPLFKAPLFLAAVITTTVFDAGVAMGCHSSCCPPVPATLSGTDTGHAQSPGDHQRNDHHKEEKTELHFCTFNLNA